MDGEDPVFTLSTVDNISIDGEYKQGHGAYSARPLCCGAPKAYTRSPGRFHL